MTCTVAEHAGVARRRRDRVAVDRGRVLAWQVGMYGGMAIAWFAIFRRSLDGSSPVFWFVMQIAMWLGFITSYPVNWWLVRSGRKESM